MPHLIKKKVKGKEYFYLASSVKVSGKTKKFQVYIGSKKPLEKELRKYSAVLKRRVNGFALKSDPLLSIISEKESKDLESIKRAYKRLLKQSPAVKENYYEWFITTYTYDSNAIEGSMLSLRETALVLFEGLSPPGRPMRDIIAAENHKKSFDWMLSYKMGIDKRFILKLHKILTSGVLSPLESGKLRKFQVYVRGAEEIPPKPEEVELKLGELIKWYKINKTKYHPIVLASYFHSMFEKIHPFVDFNGRTGRLLLNFILLKHGYPPVDIRNKDKQRYYNAIRSAIVGNFKPFVALAIKYVKETGEKFK